MRSKNRNQKEKEMTQRGVLIEDLDSKLDLVLEGYSALDKKIDKNHGEFQKFVQEVNLKFEVVFEKFKEIDNRFEGIDAKFEIVFEDLRDIRGVKVG